MKNVKQTNVSTGAQPNPSPPKGMTANIGYFSKIGIPAQGSINIKPKQGRLS